MGAWHRLGSVSITEADLAVSGLQPTYTQQLLTMQAQSCRDNILAHRTDSQGRNWNKEAASLELHVYCAPGESLDEVGRWQVVADSCRHPSQGQRQRVWALRW